MEKLFPADGAFPEDVKWDLKEVWAIRFLTGRSLDSSFPLLNATQMEYDEILPSLWKICCWLQGNDQNIIFDLERGPAT